MTQRHKRKRQDPFEELRKKDEARKQRAQEIQKSPDVRLARKIEGGPENREGRGEREGGSFRGG